MPTETKICQNCKQSFVIEDEDFAFYKKIDVPPPTWCWRCRAMRRMSFRNMHQLYKRTCDATGKTIFTHMPPDAPMPVYSREYWGSDAWDPLSYGRDYDFSRPFFEQMRDLYNTVPWASMWDFNKVNSDYSISAWVKNCYMCFDTGYVEDSAYAVTLHGNSKHCFDVINCEQDELCYYCINTNESYRVLFSRNCTSCIDVWFSQDCIGCNNCFGCSGLRNKSYHIFNKPYPKGEYEKKLKEMNLDSFSGIEQARQKSTEVWEQYPVKYQHSVRAKDCTGDYIYSSTKIRNCFFVGNSENCANSQSIIYGPNKDSADISSVGENAELYYESICAGNGTRVAFVYDCDQVTETYYALTCIEGNNLFGCVGLRNKSYCVLNKQYSKEEYQNLIPKIIQHMNDMPYADAKGRVYKYGEFFPPDMSPFGYNETEGQEYFPITKKEAEDMGYRWRDPDKRTYEVTKTSSQLPDRIADVDDGMLQEVIQCMHDEKKSHGPWCGANCATAFRITAQELQFYRQLSLPLPRLCFNCRHFDRVAWRNEPQLYHRKCTCAGDHSENKVYANTVPHFHGATQCPNELETSYAPNRKEIVYCEACYNAEIV